MFHRAKWGGGLVVHPPWKRELAMPPCSRAAIFFSLTSLALLKWPQTKTVVWNFDAPANTEIHTAQPFGTNSGVFIQNGEPAKFVILNKTTRIFRT